MPNHIIQLTLDEYDQDTEVVVATPSRGGEREREGEEGIAAPRRLVIVVPGNPGVAVFYRDFAQSLADRLDARIAVISHLGHGTHPVPLSGSLSLPRLTWREQVVHKEVAAAAIVDLFRPDTVSLAGHSIGAMMIAHMGARSTSLPFPVDRYLMLFPTFLSLAAGLAPAVRLAILPIVRLFLALLLHILPRFARDFLLSRAEAMSDEARYHSANRICAHFVLSILYMAATEAAEIGDEFDEESSAFFRTVRTDQVSFVYGPLDAYTPPHLVRRIATDFPHLAPSVSLAPKWVKHAFVLEHSEIVAEMAAERLGVLQHDQLD